MAFRAYGYGVVLRLISGVLAASVLLASPYTDAREWKARTGSFSVEADFIQIKDGKVFLERKSDGSVVPVPIEKLSFDDYDYLRTITDKKVRDYLRDHPLPLRGLVTFIEEEKNVNSIDFSPQGDLLAVATDGGLTLYSTKDWRKKIFLKAVYYFDFKFCKFSPDGKGLITANFSGHITTYSVANGSLTKRGTYPKLHGRYLIGAAFSRDGKFVLTCDASGSNVYWNWQTGSLVHRLRGDGVSNATGTTCFINPKGTQGIGVTGKSIVLYDLVSGKPIQKLPCAPREYFKISLAPSIRLFAVSHYTDTHLINLVTGEILGKVEEARSRPVQISPRGKFLAVGSARSRTEIYTIPQLELVTKFYTPSLSRLMTISPDDRYLAVAHDEELHVFKMPAGDN